MLRIFTLMWSVLMLFALGEYAFGLTEFAGLHAATWPQAILFSSVNAAAFAALVFALGRWARIVFVTLLVHLAVTAAVEGFLKVNFFDRGLFGEAMMATLIDTNLSEIGEFARTYLDGRTLLCGGLGLLMLVPALCGIMFIPVRKPGLKSWIAFAVIEVAGLFCLPCGVGADQVLPALCEHEFLHPKNSWRVYWDLKTAGRPVPPDAGNTDATNRLVVVAIGESSTRRNWSLYGYRRKTTPELQAIADELIVFSNCVSTAYLTPFALRESLTSANGRLGRVSVPAIAVAAGYESVLLSAQGRWGLFDGADELLFKTCRERLYLCEQVKPPNYDGQLLPFLKREISRSPTNQVVFLHFYGSHSDWSQRYPPAFGRFSGVTNDCAVGNLEASARKRINDYDNSIAYTDHVLADCIAALKALKRPSVFVYFSDHGETPRATNRDPSRPEIFDIPFFVWASPEMRAAKGPLFDRLASLTAKKTTSRDLPAILLDLLSVSSR